MKSLHLAAALLALAACTAGNTDTDFLCGAEEGQPCRTMGQVDGRATVSRSSAQPASQARTTASQVVSGETRTRLPERTGRMWVAPHLDERGVVHEGATVQFVVRSPRWAT